MRLATRARLYLAPLIFGFLVFNYVYLLSWLLRNYQTYNDEATRLENSLSTGITFYHLDKSTNKPTSVEIIAEADPESAIAVRATYLRNHMFHPMSYRFFSLLMYSFLVVQVTEEQFLRDNLVIATLTTVASSLIIFLEGGLLPMNIFAFWSKGLFDFAIFFQACLAIYEYATDKINDFVNKKLEFSIELAQLFSEVSRQHDLARRLPDRYFCQITLDVMRFPTAVEVTWIDTNNQQHKSRHHFDRIALQTWLKDHATNPASNIDLRDHSILYSIEANEALWQEIIAAMRTLADERHHALVLYNPNQYVFTPTAAPEPTA